MFDIITFEDITLGTWKGNKDLRDSGHQKRIMKLYSIASRNNQYISETLTWLFEGEINYFKLDYFYYIIISLLISILFLRTRMNILLKGL